ncbi:sugar ABC transporter permease [Paenibacillus agaridevorans]|jgi:putative aldouronate transport system permease protein|uniref:Sugar ABC transporter permease n=1 Tax=Paenibacillus agaridevorans TaxID=171404 RepID=A0A2R5F0Q8_9BACL|nr:carbohydrate ABC transporter permease [Paenibacillus agaridevorans]GBG09231.1 sugar ABC transporter permease [Paenibacillus agaridevorans]
MHYKVSPGDRVFDFINYLIMILVFIVMVFPFLHLINYSLSNPSLVSGKFLFYPKQFNLDSYRAIFANPDVLNGIYISLARTIIGTSFMAIVTSMAAYVITRDDMVGIKFIRRYFVFTMYFSGGIIPTYILIKSLGLVGTFWVYVIPSAVSVFNMILIKTYIEGIPKELEESALIDGANDAYLFARIILPLCLPVMAAISLFAGIGQWNAFIDTQFYNAMHPELFPLQYVLYNSFQTITSVEQFTNSMSGAEKFRMLTPQSLKIAMTVITVLPIMLVYPFLQKYFMKGLLLGAVKG